MGLDLVRTGLDMGCNACRHIPRHARPCAGHPRLSCYDVVKTWIPAPSAGMTVRGGEAHCLL
ncbi:hypothetical protein CEF00_13060, partial [Lactobacillus crispatus]